MGGVSERCVQRGDDGRHWIFRSWGSPSSIASTIYLRTAVAGLHARAFALGGEDDVRDEDGAAGRAEDALNLLVVRSCRYALADLNVSW